MNVITADTRFCEAEIATGTLLEPRQYCDNVAEPGAEFCDDHAEDVEDEYEGPAERDYGYGDFDDAADRYEGNGCLGF